MRARDFSRVSGGHSTNATEVACPGRSVPFVFDEAAGLVSRSEALGQEIPASLQAMYCAERVVAVFALVFAAPVIFALAVLTALLSRRSPFIRHLRVGWRGRALAMWKLRTMWDKNEPREFRLVETVWGAPPDKNRTDARVSGAFAVFCRRYSLDELPQLIHVARGEMSFVGPRPITLIELEEHYSDCMEEVVSVRPGVTGLWQIKGRNRLSYSQRRRLDLFLVRHAGVRIYLGVLLRSIPAALSGDGAR